MLLVALAAAACATWFVADPLAALPGVPWGVLAALFAVAEVLVIHLPSQGSSHSHTLREIPAVAGLTFLAPQQYVTAYVVGAGLALLLCFHQRGIKLVFNLALYSLEAALGLLVYHAVLGTESVLEPRAWAAAAAAVLATDLVAAAAVTSAISLTEGRLDTQVMREALRSGIPAAMVNTCVALLLVTLLVVRPSALPLLGVIVVILLVGYRAYMVLARRHAQMQLLYRFVGTTGRTTQMDQTVPTVLAEAAELLRAARADLVAPFADTAHAWVCSWQDDRLTETSSSLDAADAWWRPALRGESVLLRSEPGVRRDQAGTDPRDGLAVPVHEDGEVVAVLLVTDRTFEEETFSAEDLRLFEALAAHASVALARARVVQRLETLVAEREHEALHDQLTDLPNRRAFHEALETAMARGETGAVLLLDLDDFKDVNDTLGHSVGDGLLGVVGDRLLNDGAGLAARLGGDEFAVLLVGCDLPQAREQACLIQQLVAEPVPLADVRLATSASIGVAGFVGRSCSGEELLGRADVAMYAAKAARSGVELFRPEDGDSTARRLRLAADLPAAVADRTWELWFQPQARSETGEVTGFEALLRWNHPEFGMVPPPEIVAVATRTGLMPTLTADIIDQALRARQRWSEQGHDLDVSVNVTPRDVGDKALPARVDASLVAAQTPPGALVLEITESDELGDLDRVLGVLEDLAARGVRLSVDDFGTGYSSLAYLDRLPVHELKIDQSFVFRLERETADTTIVRAAVSLAHQLGLRVVAEGVENEVTRARVAEMGCDLFQGYGLARPMPEEQVIGWLATRRKFLRGLHVHPAALV